MALLLAALATGGYFAYQVRQHAADVARPTPVAKQSRGAGVKGTPRRAGEEYRVPELGFVMELPQGLAASDLYYIASDVPTTATTYTGATYTVLRVGDFSTYSLAAVEPTCRAHLDELGGRALGMIAVTDLDPTTGAVAAPELAVRLGPAAYLSLLARQSSCATPAHATLEAQQYNFLKAALRTAHAL